MPIIHSRFRPAWWLRSPHAQTLWPALLRRSRALALNWERVELEDGDFLDLAWSGPDGGRIILLLHGLHPLQLVLWRQVGMHRRDADDGRVEVDGQEREAFAAAIVSLAVKGVLEIEEEDPKAELSFTNNISGGLLYVATYF